MADHPDLQCQSCDWTGEASETVLAFDGEELICPQCFSSLEAYSEGSADDAGEISCGHCGHYPSADEFDEGTQAAADGGTLWSCSTCGGWNELGA